MVQPNNYELSLSFFQKTGYTNEGILPFMETISRSIANMESQLSQFNSRLSSIEDHLFSAVLSQENPSHFSSPFPSYSFEPEISIPTNTSLVHPEDLTTLSSCAEIIKTPPPHRSTHATTTTVSPLLNYSGLTAEKTNKIKHLKSKDRKQYVRGIMDVMFSKDEMASSNLGGKRQKATLDEGRADLVKRKPTSTI